MLSRRFLRIKAMQAVYAYYQKIDSYYNISIERINDSFMPDLNSMETPDHAHLDFCKKQALAAFEKSYKTKKITDAVEPEVKEAVAGAISHYHNSNKKDQEKVQQQMLEDTQSILHHYYNILSFFVAFQDFVASNKKRKEKRGGVINTVQFNFADNKIIHQLRESSQYIAESAKVAENWLDEESILRTINRETILEDDVYQGYTTIAKPSFQEDKEVVLHLIKKVLFKNELFLSHFEELDVRWEENAEIVKTLLVKTIKKSMEEEACTLFSLSSSWDDDKQYFIDLFRETIGNNKSVKEAINSKLQNWDEERVAISDRIILEMAVSEMINFPSIPIKVSLNEFVEIAKNYSTPKSKVFVNGVLDAVSKEFIEKGIIKKSGRGLIDNN